MSARESTPSDVPRGEAGKWLPGHSANPGGIRKRTAEIERMLDEDFRSVAKMRFVYRKLRRAALRELEDGKNEGFTKLLLERLQGPVKEAAVNLEGVSDAALAELRTVLRQ